MNNIEKLLGLCPTKISHPPIHWAGGKGRLLKTLYKHFSGTRLIEPFMGSCVVGINSSHSSVIFNDLNKDLVNLFENIRDRKDEMIEKTNILFAHNDREHYLEYRKQFNESKDPFERSYLFLYINRHGFNGLCRYSANGNYNVAYGAENKNINPPIKEIKEVSKILNEKNAIFTNLDFLEVMDMAVDGDMIYADPPYVPLTISAHTNYTGAGFGMEEQTKLRDKALELRERGIKTIISNNSTPITQELYKDANNILEVELYRPISGKGDMRTKAMEIIAIFGEK
jgi:DNA adenine methylase